MATIQDTLVLQDQFSPTVNRYTQSLLRAQSAAGQAQTANTQFGSSAVSAAQNASSLANTLKNLASAYLGIQGAAATLNLSDTISQTTARLDSMGDRFSVTMNQVYESAQRSRGALTDTANMVAKLGNLAGEAFGNSQELVDFAEQLNKQIVLSGASTAAADAAMLQLTQAMSSGLLRGEELNSILEQTPTIAKTIAEYMGVTTGTMREMASEGQVTATVVKNALLGAADEVNAKFEKMTMTWAQVWTSFQNTAIIKLQPVLNGINWLANNLQIIGPLVMGAAGAFAVFQVAAHWTTIATTATAAYHFVVNLLTIGYGVLTGSAGAASAAVFTFNSALLASPVTWVVMGVMLLVGALYAGVAAYNKLTESSVSATGIITGAALSLVAFIINGTIVPIYNGFASLANFLYNVFTDPVAAVKALFLDMVTTALGYVSNLAHGIEGLINAIPGVEVNITSGIDDLYNKVKSASQSVKDEAGLKEYLKHTDGFDLSAAYSAGYNWGSNLFSGSGSTPTAAAYTNIPTFDQISGIADSVEGIKKSVEMTDEDLQSLVDIAERRYVNNINLTSQAPVINVTGQNTGNTPADRQNLANALRDILVQQVAAGSVQTTARAF